MAGTRNPNVAEQKPVSKKIKKMESGLGSEFICVAMEAGDGLQKRGVKDVWAANSGKEMRSKGK